MDPGVAAWWKAKADEIYSIIPDFGGFLVKANSEGQPGPGDYHRTHAQGANVAISGTKAERLEAIAAELGSRVFVLPCDLRDRREARPRTARKHDGSKRQRGIERTGKPARDHAPKCPRLEC